MSAQIRRRVLALGLLLALAVVLPLAGYLTAEGEGLLGYSGVARGEFENWAWLDWWIPRYAECLLREQNGRWTALLALPQRLDIGNYLDGLLISQPLKAALGNVAGHNARVVVVLLLNGLASTFLCWQALRLLAPAGDEGNDPLWPAVVGGVALACNPVTLWDIAESRFAQALIAGWALWMGCLFRWMRAPSTRNAVWAALAYALSGLVYWYAALFVVPLLLGALALRLREWRTWTLQVVLGGVVMLPFVLPFLGPGQQRHEWGTPFPPLQGLAIPPPGALGPPGPGLIVSQSLDLHKPLTPPLGPSAGAWWPVLALASIVACVWRTQRRVALLLAVCAGGWWLFALGPYPRVESVTETSNPLYMALYRYVPFVWRLNWPARTLPFVLAALVALSVPLVARIPRRWWAILAAASIMLAPAIAGHVLPLPVTPLTVPEAYRRGLPGDPSEGVVELSFPFNSGVAGWYQSWHGRPVLGNQAYCPPAISDWPPTWARDPRLLEQMGRLDSPEALARLRDAGFRWLIVQRVYANQPVWHGHEYLDSLRATLGRPTIDTPEMCAWHMD